MVKNLAKMWWLLALKGVFAILFGILILAWPGLTIGVLVIIYGVFALVGGILSMIISLFSIGKYSNWWVMFLEGVLGFIVGGIVLKWPAISLLLLVIIIGIWVIISGIAQIITAFFVRQQIKNEWLMALSGLISLLFGLLLFSWPISGIIVLSWLIGFYALLLGIFLIVFGFQVKTYLAKG